MGHYWAADTPIEIRRELAHDWLDDLREFGPAIVSEACLRWRRTESRRPTPADIRKLAIEVRNESRQSEEVLMLPAPERERRIEAKRRREEEMIRGGRQITEAWARAAGYENFDAYLDAGGTFEDALPHVLAFSTSHGSASAA